MELLDRQEVDIFILDDGFQHYLLKRDLDIVTIDGNRKFGNGRLLPAGILREPVSSLKHADLVIVRKSDTKDLVFEDDLNRYTKAPVHWSEYQPLGLSRLDPPGPGSGRDRPPGSLLAFCGIAGPAGFRRTLEKANVEILDLLVFPDHHRYSDADWENITAAGEEKGAVGLVTTEKDTVRLPSLEASLPVYSLPVRLEVERSEVILEQVLALVGSERTASVK